MIRKSEESPFQGLQVLWNVKVEYDIVLLLTLSETYSECVKSTLSPD